MTGQGTADLPVGLFLSGSLQGVMVVVYPEHGAKTPRTITPLTLALRSAWIVRSHCWLMVKSPG